MKRLIKKFRETESISDLKHSSHPSTNRSIQNIKAVHKRESRNINLAPLKIGHFEKLSTAYSHKIFASSCLRSSIDSKTKAY